MEMIKQKSDRKTNIELLRVICMIMIITHHILYHGEVLNNITYSNWKYYVLWTIDYVSIVAVNIYVLISGYFMVNSKIKIKKVLLLEFEILFYSIGIYIILHVFGLKKFQKHELLEFIFPITSQKYWFMTAYMGLYLLTPMLNKVANSLNVKEYRYTVLILIILISLMPTIYPTNYVLNAGNGYQILWFIALYLIAGYIRLHFDIKKINKTKLVITYIFMIIIQLLLRLIFTINSTDFGNTYLKSDRGYNTLFVFIESLALFLLFCKFSVKNKYINNIIRYLSPSVLGVYLIHEHPMLRPVIWNIIIMPYKYLNNWKIFLYMILWFFSIFVIGIIIDKIRILIFNCIAKINLIRKISNKIDNYADGKQTNVNDGKKYIDPNQQKLINK